MFVEDVTPIMLPVAVAQERLLAFLQVDGLQSASSDAFSKGRALLLRAEFAGLSKQVIVQNLAPYPRGETTVIPIRWVATGPVADPLPPLDANLELDPAEDGTSRLALSGIYRPPFGRIGAKLDRYALHRAARATVDGFLSQVSRAILAPHLATTSLATVNALGDSRSPGAGS